MSRAFFEWTTLGAFGVMVLLGVVFWAIGARNLRRGLLGTTRPAAARPQSSELPATAGSPPKLSRGEAPAPPDDAP
jgi:hypothetical protein